MYDELVKALRETDFGDTCVLCEHEDMCKGNDCIIIQAADAIEERCQQVDKFAEEAARLYAKQPRWIPVTEALPEDECPVLVTYLGFHDRSPRANMLAYIDRDLGWCWWNDDIPDGTPCIVEITHWMPLPQPPKEET